MSLPPDPDDRIVAHALGKPPSMLDAALELAVRGRRVQPAFEGDKRPLHKKGATGDPALLATWYAGPNENANVGLALGKDVDLIVVEIDPKAGGTESLAELQRRNGELPPTAVSRTASGQFHYFFRYPRRTPATMTPAPGLTLLDTPYVLVEPSRYQGAAYSWVEPLPDQLAAIPNWLIEPMKPISRNGDAAERSDEAAERRSSWLGIDLIRAELEPHAPPDGVVYAGRRHVWSGETESCKSFAALDRCAHYIRAGRNALYVDLEMGAREMTERLRAFGLTDEEISSRFIYVDPSEPLADPTVVAEFHQMLDERQPAIAIIDAFTGLLEMHGLDPNSGVDVERCYRLIVDPIRARGAGTIILDHVPKDRDTRGRYAIASERKIGGCDVHLGFEVIRQFGRGRSGLVKVRTHKDRPGHLPRPHCADLELISDPTTGLITAEWRAIDRDSTAGPADFRPTRLMEKASAHLELSKSTLTRNQIVDAVGGNKQALLTGIRVLLAEGFLVESVNDSGRSVVSSARPYRECEDPKASA